MELLRNPVLHRKAILCGIKSEKVSMLLEDILSVRCAEITPDEYALIAKSGFNKYKPEPTDYIISN